jgi:HJR/Mrr/RecB family endonuclease
MVVTNNIFTKSAVELAEANNIKLLDGEKLNNIITQIIQKIYL